MSQIRIHLTDGFEQDHVVVRVDGRTVLDEWDVTYSPLYGFTGKSASTEVESGRCEVEVELPEKGLRLMQEFEISASPHVVVAVENGRIDMRSLREVGFG